jgi:hypothetical protein
MSSVSTQTPSWLGVATTILPSQITIASTGATVDLVPRIFINESPPIAGAAVALSNTENTSTTIFTSPSVEAGTYQVSVSYEIDNDGTAVAWNTAEQVILFIGGTGGTGLTVRPLLNFQPAYVNQTAAANDPIYITQTGLVTTTSATTLTCNVQRTGTLSTNKQATVYSMTAQKIA